MLNWSVQNVKNFNDVCFETVTRGGQEGRQIKPMTENLIWMTVIIGVGEITQGNADEFFSRTKMHEGKNGCGVRMFDGKEMVDVPVTIEDVMAHIGLHTNASKLTRKQFEKKLQS